MRVFAQYDRAFEEEVRTSWSWAPGPCGAVAAYELAAAGRDVILVEEGPPFTVRDFELRREPLDDPDDARGRAAYDARHDDADHAGDRPGRRLARELGDLRATAGLGLRSLGDALRPRTHESRANLDPHYDAVGEVPGHRAHAGRRAGPAQPACSARPATRSASTSEPIARNVRGCRGSGECFTGCRSRAKQSVDVSYVPAALRAGARVFTSLQVQQVRSQTDAA